MKIRLRQRLVYWFGRSAISVAAALPQWLGYGAAAALGRLYFRCSRRRRDCARRFLGAAFPGMPEREMLRLGRVATGNIFKVPIDMCRVSSLLARGRDLGSVVDSADFVRALPPPPFLAISAHLGSWEVAAMIMGELFGAHAVVRTFKNPLLQRWILQNRRSGGLFVHPRRGGIRHLAAALKDGAVGLQVVDQHQRLRGIMAPFFGRIASCERAAVSLALRHGYPICVGGAVRVGHGFRFRLVGGHPFVPRRSGDRAADLLAAVTEMNARLERMIVAHKEQYLWIHDRYRDAPAPPGAAAGGQP